MDFAGVAAIKAMKDQIERAEGRAGSSFNLKIVAGGIRDIEFVTQALQLLYGGRMRQVRGRSTQQALTALAQVGILPRTECDALRGAYAFLRRAENRVQMEGERQAHRLPADARGRVRLARAMGFTGDDAVATFERALQAHRQRVRAAFAALFADDGAPRLLDLFQRSVPALLAEPVTRTQIEHLATHFARAVAASPAPERALNNLDRFIRATGSRTFYYGLLVDRPELVERLAGLFAASEFRRLHGLAPAPHRPIFSDLKGASPRQRFARAGADPLRSGGRAAERR
jgi:glutamate-ammonia-ligase adenylyltransferase